MFKIKAGEEYEDKSDSLFEVNKILWRVALLEAVIIMALVFGYLQLKDTTYVKVEIPPKLYLKQNLTITKGLNWANKSYFQVWGKSLVEDISNFTVDNISKKMSTIEKMMRPSIALKRDNIIAKYTKAVINNKISQKFEILKEKVVKISKAERQLIYYGISYPKIGSKKVKSKECKYIVNLKIYNNGVLYVEDFGTNCL